MPTYPSLGIVGQQFACLVDFVTDLLIKIFTWFAFLSVGSTALLLAVTGWIYLLKKVKAKGK